MGCDGGDGDGDGNGDGGDGDGNSARISEIMLTAAGWLGGQKVIKVVS